MIENAVILAAGMGTRLKPLTDSAPKCMTEVNGTPIIFNALRSLENAGVKKCTVVTGHFAESIRDRVGPAFGSLEIAYLYNDRYSETNDMYSLWLARDCLEAGTFVLEGDIFFKRDLPARAGSGFGNESGYIAGPYNGDPGEILITAGPGRKISSIELLGDASGEAGPGRYMSSGLLVVNRDFGPEFSRWMGKFVNEGMVNVLFDAVLSEHAGEHPISVYPIEHTDWVEIDTLDDLARAERTFA